MPSTPEKLQADQAHPGPFLVAWAVTKLGIRYEMPDMLPQHIDALCKQCEDDLDNVTLTNVSGVVMILPKRILESVGVGMRCFWRASD